MTQLPAIFSNQFQFIVNPLTTRITFCDEPMTGIPPVIHTAVVMKTSDAEMFAKLLLKLIEQNKDTVTVNKLLGGDS